MRKLAGVTAGIGGLLAGFALIPAGAQGRQTAMPQSYVQNCQMCHQANARGVAGLYPRLAGRSAQIARMGGGRDFLVAVTLYGQAGRIEVDGKPIVGVMPSFASLPDAKLAQILTYLVSLDGGGAKPFDAAEIARGRRKGLSPTKVLAMRNRLSGAGADLP